MSDDRWCHFWHNCMTQNTNRQCSLKRDLNDRRGRAGNQIACDATVEQLVSQIVRLCFCHRCEESSFLSRRQLPVDTEFKLVLRPQSANYLCMQAVSGNENISEFIICQRKMKKGKYAMGSLKFCYYRFCCYEKFSQGLFILPLTSQLKTWRPSVWLMSHLTKILERKTVFAPELYSKGWDEKHLKNCFLLHFLLETVRRTRKTESYQAVIQRSLLN